MEFAPAPRRLDPPAGEVHVWRATASTPSSLVARRVLARYLGAAPEEIELARGEHGKPELAAEPDRLAFNLSHSGELALLAVSQGREVGIDVERIKPGRNLVGIAERALGPGPAKSVREAKEEDRDRIFHEHWTRHEARLKCLGVGLATVPGRPSPALAVESLAIGPGFTAAVAVTGAAVPVRAWTLD